MKVAFVIGHDKTSPGAYSPYLGMSEYLYHCEVASYLCEFDIYKRPIGGGYKTQMRKLADEVNKKDYDLVIELHFNRFDGEADNEGEGCEALYYKDNEFTQLLGEQFCDHITDSYNTVKRGAKEVGFENQRGYWFLRNMKAPAMILEPFFGDELEAEKFKNPGQYAEVLKNWLCN